MRVAAASRFAGCDSLAGMLDRLPAELRDHVGRLAGHLTELLHGRLAQPMAEPTARLVVADCFRQDHVAAVPLLPHRLRLTFEPLYIHSEAMRQAAVHHFEHADDTLVTGLDLSDPPSERLLRGLDAAVRSQYTPALAPVLSDLLDMVFAQVHEPFDHDVASRLIDCAVGLGRRDMVETLLPHAFGTAFGCAAAGRNGQADMVAYMAGRVWTGRSAALDGAIQGGHLRLIKALVPALDETSDDMPWRLKSSVLDAALGAGHAATIEWLLRDAAETLSRHNPRWLKSVAGTMRNKLAEFGCRELLEFVTEKGIGGPLNSAAMDGAATQGNLDMLRWLHAHAHVPCSSRTLIEAADNGHLEAFEWIWETFPTLRLSAFSLRSAALHGHLWVVESLARRCDERLDILLECALQGGHVAIAELLAAMGRAAPSADMMAGIAARGQIASARWLHSQVRGTYSPKCVQIADQHGHTEMVQFLVASSDFGVPLARGMCLLL
ncbi:hypothetical protein HK105_201111 [Polyrhizophydium stewartii]|uniref:Ankyrin repeat protein n=1 Tax=Polyrhizophydium stewartii TaxID=2732419 RepID=A0ABR4NIX0_9FUNG